MKQLLILSGKGGTGKTTIASAFIHLMNARAYADCDVDAPNLHLVTDWKTQPEKKDYFGLPVADIEAQHCIACGLCVEHCRFDAISSEDGVFVVDPYACEGCGVCAFVCPVNAITMLPAVAGELKLFSDRQKVFSTAQLKMGSGTSGLLVSEVKKQMRESGIEASVAIIDGSPGIGCPVIASLSGVDLVLIVAEPSISGISDMERILRTAVIFGIKSLVCINKFDTNLGNTEKIKEFCIERKIPFVGEIPFDTEALRAINQGKSIVEIDCPSATAVKSVYERTMHYLSHEEQRSKI